MKVPSPPAAALGVLLAAAGCQGRLAHQFGAYAYDANGDCLAAPALVDVIAGADPGMCPMLRCWQAPDGSIYVTSTACDAPPGYQDHTPDGSGPCVKALAAFARPGHGLCPAAPDGGADGGDGGP